jgi:hypothetical protein
VFRPSAYVHCLGTSNTGHSNETTLLARALLDGHFPLWDPYTYCGLPYFANMQGHVFYPPTLITALAASCVRVRTRRRRSEDERWNYDPAELALVEGMPAEPGRRTLAAGARAPFCSPVRCQVVNGLRPIRGPPDAAGRVS